MVESPRLAAGVYGINNRRRSIFSVRDRRASRRQAAKDSETDCPRTAISAHPHGRPVRRESFAQQQGKSLLTGALLAGIGGVIGAFVGYQARRRLVNNLRINDLFVAIWRRFGCDCSSLFPSLALTQTRPIPISLFLHGRSPVASLGI